MYISLDCEHYNCYVYELHRSLCLRIHNVQMQTKKLRIRAFLASLRSAHRERHVLLVRRRLMTYVHRSTHRSAHVLQKQTGIQGIRSKRCTSTCTCSLKSKPFETAKHRDYHLENMWPIPGFGAAYFPGAARPSCPY